MEVRSLSVRKTTRENQHDPASAGADRAVLTMIAPYLTAPGHDHGSEVLR